LIWDGWCLLFVLLLAQLPYVGASAAFIAGGEEETTTPPFRQSITQFRRFLVLILSNKAALSNPTFL